MFEIGSALVQARHRLGVDFAEAEQGTRLRARYLRALEAEQFDELPRGYRRSFLRSYASFLGLDADLLVEEYVARYEPYDRSDAPGLPRPVPHRRRGRYRTVAIAALLLVLLAALAAALLLSGKSNPTPERTRTSGSTTTAASAHATSTPRAAQQSTHAGKHVTRQKPRPIRLVLAATTGPCWVSVHEGSQQGRTAYEGTLEPGQSISLHGSRYWARIGAPAALSLTVDGKVRALPGQTANLLIDAQGVHAAP